MSEWVTKPLGKLAEFKKGKKVHTSDMALPGYKAYLGASSLSGGHDAYAAPNGGVPASTSDVLMLWDGENSGLVGKGKDGVISSTVMRLQPKEEITTDFLRQYLQLNFEWIQNRRTGTGVPHVPKDLSRILDVKFPKKETLQLTISAVLNALDSQIEQTEALIAKQENIRQGLMQDLFTRGVDETGQLRPAYKDAPHLYHETELGWLPKGWEVDLLDNKADRVSGHTPNRKIPSYWDGGIKWVSLADSSKLDNYYIYKTKFEISQKGIENSSAVVHPAGTVFVSRDAGVGKSAIMAYPMAVSQHFMAWRCSDQLSNVYLYYTLQNRKREFENIATGSTIVTIGLSYFKKLMIGFPKDVDEQNLIGTILTQSDDRVSKEKKSLAKLQKQKAGLMRDLLSGDVSVAPLMQGASA